MLLAATTYGNWTPPLLSEHGGQIDQLIDFVHWFMLLLFVPWLIFFLYCLVRYRKNRNSTALYAPIKAKISKYAEVGVAIIEVILLVGFSAPVWAEYKNSPPAADKRLEIRVVAQQFQWNFHYAGKDGAFGKTDVFKISASNPIGLDETDPASADDIVTINDFHIPAGRDIYLRLSSKDVIHSFAITTMRVKQDVIPGMEIPIWFKVLADQTSAAILPKMIKTVPIDKLNWYKHKHFVASKDHTAKGEVVLAKGADLGPSLDKGNELIASLKKAGVTELSLQPHHAFEVICAQLCGNSHFKMKANMTTYDDAGFEAWMAEQSVKPEMQEF
jgi:cytochrome c oxidase subunit 2